MGKNGGDLLDEGKLEAFSPFRLDMDFERNPFEHRP
jgi:hypothetical protein